MKPREPTITMEDVAQRAGVSRALVSIVFRGVPGAGEVTRERVLAAAKELGYRPDQRARLLSSRRTGLVGVVFGLRHEFHAALLEGLYREVAQTDYQLTLSPYSRSRPETEAVQSLVDYRCEALIMLGPGLTEEALMALAAKVPIVVVARKVGVPGADVVRTDDERGAALAVEHLVGLGHSRIAHIDGGRSPGAAQRRRGYRRAMRAHGLADFIRICPGGLDEEHGERAFTDLMASAQRPSAVTAFNDSCAVGVISAARLADLKLPHDLSIVGFDDSRVARLRSVSLTTVAQDAQQLAATAVRLALSRANEPNGARTEVVVPPGLVLRTSTRRHVGEPPLEIK